MQASRNGLFKSGAMTRLTSRIPFTYDHAMQLDFFMGQNHCQIPEVPKISPSRKNLFGVDDSTTYMVGLLKLLLNRPVCIGTPFVYLWAAWR